MLFIDIDEFIDPKRPLRDICISLTKGGYDGALFNEIPMDSRWNWLDRPITEITDQCGYHEYYHCKLLCYLPRTFHVNVHMFRSISAQKFLNIDILNFRHYRCIHKNDDYKVVGEEALAPLVAPDHHLNYRPSSWFSRDWKDIMEKIPGNCIPMIGVDEAIADGDKELLKSFREGARIRQFYRQVPATRNEGRCERMRASKFAWKLLFK